MNKYTQYIQDKILELHQKNWSSRMIANELDISKSGVNDWLKLHYSSQDNTVQKKPKVLVLDLESAPSIAVAFGRFKVNLSQDSILKEGGYLLTYAYKWLGEERIYSNMLNPADAIEGRDEGLVAELWDAIESADAVLAHNLLNFDLPLLKARCIVNGLPPLKKVQKLDSLVLSKEFRFNSNKLDSLCSQLDIGRKIQHSGIDLWVRCINGDMQALQEMLEYNEQDVLLLEELYNTIKPYSTRHPNLAVHYTDAKMRCNCCASTDVEPTGNTVTTNLSVFTEYKCNSCNARFKDRTSLTTKEQRKNFLSN